MYIALVNSFPNRPHTAEIEFIARFKQVARQLGHQAEEVVTSDDILACEPDFVIATHEFTPKLTPHLTLGAMWNPPSFFAFDPYRIKSVLSHDGHLVGSEHIRTWLDNLEYSVGVNKPKSEFLFLPTSPSRVEVALVPTRRELVYTGIHWDALRHDSILSHLSSSGTLNVYGPRESWASLPNAYRGTVSFDGFSLYSTLAKHGVALCFNTEEHRIADTPSMRLFEAAAAGCVIISDEIPFAKRALGTSAFYVNLSDPEEVTSRKILHYLDWINTHPSLANEMARKSRELLARQFSLELMVAGSCEFAQQIRDDWATARFRAVKEISRVHFGSDRSSSHYRDSRPLVDVIVRSGGRPVQYVRRALRSIANQDLGTYRVLLIDYKGRDDLRSLATANSTNRMQIHYIQSTDTGFRSTSMWTGLRAVQAPFFAMLDDDDELMPDHFSSLLWLSLRKPEHGLYYSGVIRREEEEKATFDAPNFSGLMGLSIKENRSLQFLDPFSMEKFLNWEIPLTTNCWIARSEVLLDEDLLTDPKMPVSEDPYFYFLLAAKTRFVCNFRPTALWNFRSNSQDNSVLGVGRREQDIEVRNAIRSRLRHKIFPQYLSITQVDQEPEQPFPEGMSVLLNRRNFDRFRRRGFNASEDNGTWTNARESWVNIGLGEPAAGLFIELSLTVPKDQWVKICVQGRELFQGRLPAWERTVIGGQISFPRATRGALFKISCLETIQENTIGWSSDRRQLGVLLHNLKIQRV
jgi:Glycosyl transferase family 2/Glycosyl transferases group 1